MQDIYSAYDVTKAYTTNTSAAPKRQIEPSRRAEIKRLPVQRRQPKRKSGVATKVLIAAIVFFMLFFNIFTKVQISDVKTEIDAADAVIEELNSEETRLNMKMESMISYSKLEEAASALGMKKKSKSQVHYIDISGDDHAQIISGDE